LLFKINKSVIAVGRTIFFYLQKNKENGKEIFVTSIIIINFKSCHSSRIGLMSLCNFKFVPCHLKGEKPQVYSHISCFINKFGNGKFLQDGKCDVLSFSHTPHTLKVVKALPHPTLLSIKYARPL
jgi:hypothetical protein